MKNNTLRIILKTARKNLALSGMIVLCVALAIVLALVPPKILGDTVDNLTKGEPVGLKAAILYFLFTALAGLSEAAREGFLSKFGQKITHAFRSCLMDKYLKLPASTLLKYKSGEIVSRFVGDVDMVEKLFTSGVVSMFADACKIVSILVVIWIGNKGLFFVLLMMLPFLFLFTRTVQKNMLRAQLKNRAAIGKISGFIPETIANIRTIHNLKREGYMAEKYESTIQDSYKALEKTNFYDAVYSPVIQVVNAISVAVVMLLSASGNAKVLLIFGMTPGTAVAIVNYISQIFSPVESLGMEIQTIQSATAGLRRINEFLSQEETDFDEGIKEISEFAGDEMVKCDAVTFGYDEEPVLENFELSVRKGEKVTLMGRTGAGKSTIFKLLLGLYKPDKGGVYIDGKPAFSIPEENKRKLFGYVEQSFHRVPGSVADQITLFDESISTEKVVWAATLTGLHETIKALPNGYDTPCTDEIFSQGQWQLLSIARAVASNPKLLLLDEITADLDEVTEKEVLCALDRASKDRTLISISHRTSAMTGRVVEI